MSMAPYNFFRGGIEYYVAGRAAARCQLSSVAGNLFHHAVEMILKGELSKSLTLDDIKKQFGHKLTKAWEAVKALHPHEVLADNDSVVADLDTFEQIRYPDQTIKSGLMLSIGWGEQPPLSHYEGPQLPTYMLCIKHVDALIGRLFQFCRINPAAYFGSLHPEGMRMLEYENCEFAIWFPDRGAIMSIPLPGTPRSPSDFPVEHRICPECQGEAIEASHSDSANVQFRCEQDHRWCVPENERMPLIGPELLEDRPL